MDGLNPIIPDRDPVVPSHLLPAIQRVSPEQERQETPEERQEKEQEEEESFEHVLEDAADDVALKRVVDPHSHATVISDAVMVGGGEPQITEPSPDAEWEDQLATERRATDPLADGDDDGPPRPHIDITA